MIGAAQAAFGIDPQPFEKLLDVREGSLKPRDLDPVPLFGEYLKEISQSSTRSTASRDRRTDERLH